MKLLSIVSFIAMATSSLAQYILVGFPPSGANVLAGKPFTVELDRPGNGAGILEVNITIGLASCANAPCQTPVADMGTILYQGGYSPVIHSSTPGKPPYQSFSFTIPVNFPKGLAQLNILHHSLLPPKSTPFFQAADQPLNVL